MNKSLFIFSAALFSVFAFAVPLRFDAPADSTKTFQTSAYHGETLEIEAQLTWRNSPLAIQDGAEAAMCWQTNGMGDAWWTAPASVTTGGVVTATWSPSNDVGAASYRVFFRVAGPGGASYRANMLLRLLGSPGATPNALPLPAPFIDFAKVVVTNAPWGDAAIETDPVFEQWAATNGLPTWTEIKTGFSEWTFSPSSFNAFGVDFDFHLEAVEQYQGPGWFLRAKARIPTQVYLSPVGIIDRNREMTNWVAYAQFVNPSSVSTTSLGAVTYATTSTFVTVSRRRITPVKFVMEENGEVFINVLNTAQGAFRVGGSMAFYQPGGGDSNAPEYETVNRGMMGEAVAAATNGFASAEEIAQLRTDASLVYQLLMGSNVVAEVTNYNSRVNSPTLRLLQLDQDTKEYFTVWAETNGLTRTFNEAKAYTDATSNALDMVKADRAWSRHTSGLGADAPDGVTWISTPQTVISGGYEYERHITTHGEVWVLTSNGMGFGGDTNSYFRVSTPDGETLFSIEKTDEQIIGVQTDGISVSDGTVTLNVGVVTYNGQAPICMAAQSVNGPWADLSEGRPAWISSVVTNGVNGAWSFELESTSSSTFFYFVAKQPGATVIKNSAQTDFSGGILVEGTRFYPHKSGSTLTWTTTP